MTGTPAPPRFVGREAAFARLVPSLEEAAGGNATTVLIEGPTGVGVSRFVDEAARRVQALAEPFVVLRGRSFRSGADEPYGPILRALWPALASAPDDELGRLVGPAGEDVVRLLPELSPRLLTIGALPDRPTITSSERRHGRMLEGILGVIGRLSETAPVLLALEDLHDADAATRTLVGFLTRVQRHHRVALVGTFASDQLTLEHPLAGLLDDLAAVRRPPDRLVVAPLTRGELADLAAAIEGSPPGASTLVLVADRSNGMPLVASELLAARRELSDTSLTRSFEELVVARLAGRSTECRRVLRLLALAGRPLSEDELAGVAAAFEQTADRLPPRSSTLPRRGDGTLDPDLRAGLDEAIEHDIVRAGPDGIEFRHGRVGGAVAADLLPRQRLRHHLALASGMAAHPNAAAHHWVAAQVTDRAFAAAVDAAGRAEAVYAPEDALEALELALSLYDRATGEDGEPLEKEISTALQMRAAEAAFAAGRPARAVAYIESLLGSFDERRDRVAVGMLHDRLGRYRRATGDAAGSVAAFERAVELVPPGTTVERATVLASLAQALMLDGTFSEAERRAQEAIELARALGPDGESVLVHATTTLAVSMGWGDDPETGVAMLREARTLAADAGDHDELFRVYANLTTVLDLVGRRSEAVEVAFEGIEAARRAGLEAVYGNFLRANASDSLFLIGRWPESSAISATALEWSPAGVSFVAPIDSLAVVEIETRAGEYAGRLLGQLLLELETVRAAQHAVPVYRAAASFALWRGDHADARRAAVRGWELIRDTEDWSLIAKMAATVAEVDSAAAADARARRNLADLAGIRSRSQAVVSTARRAVEASGVSSSIGSRREADAWLALTQAHRDRLEGRDDEAAWDRLATAWNELSNPYEAARARWRQAEAVLGTGEGRAARSRARPALEEAARIAVDLGARPLLREVRELAGRAMIGLPETVDALLNDDEQTLVATMTPAGLAAGTAGAARRAAAAPGNGHSGLVPVGPGDGAGGEDGNRSPLARGVVGETAPVRTDTFGLSRREREVLALIAEGRTNREIGERLFISQKTVGVHVGNILAKLRVSGRVEAAAVAIRLGLTGSGTTGIPIGR